MVLYRLESLEGPKVSEEAAGIGSRKDNAFKESRKKIAFRILFRSPELNPIKHLWDVLKQGVKGHHTLLTNLTELWTAVANIWRVIPVVRFQKLVESMPRRMDFDKSRIVAYLDYGLSYRSIATQVGRNTMTVSRIRNRWFQNGITERCVGSKRPSIICSREDRHVILMSLMDREATSRSLSQ
ncbi:transposable element Tc1 transposase [Trichonephila clavipes]|nr:transposable element Tc1 transposase [Trichonephila clavipes]